MPRKLLASIGGEANVHPKEGDSIIIALGDTLKWKHYRSIPGFIDLDHANGKYTNVTVYAFCYLQSETAEKARILLGSDDGVAVWLNGKQVHHNPVWRPLFLDEDMFEADLQAGTNRCLVKVTQGIAHWGFEMRAFPYDQPISIIPRFGLWAGYLDNESKKVGLAKTCKYHPGGNPEWADPNFDDRPWETKSAHHRVMKKIMSRRISVIFHLRNPFFSVKPITLSPFAFQISFSQKSTHTDGKALECS